VFQRTRVLDRHIQEDEVSKLDGVNRHYPAITKVALPLLVGILIVDTVLDVVREQIFQFDRRAKSKTQLGIFPPSHSSAT